MSRFSLAGRISMIIILVAVISASISGIMNLIIARDQFADYINNSDFRMVQNIALSVKDYYTQNGTLTGYQQVQSYPRMGAGYGRMNGMMRQMGMGGARFIVVDNHDLVVADSYSELLGQTNDATSLGLKSYPVSLDNGEQIGKVYVSSPLKNGIKSLENTFIHNISIQTVMSILIVSIFALLFGIFLARGITLPLAELSNGIHSLAEGNLQVRVKPKGDRELYSLGNDFNRMAQKLQDYEESRHTLFANIAHELRTPLSILRGQLEAIQTRGLQVTEKISSSLVDEVIRLTLLVRDLETIGLAESGALRLNIVKVTVDEIRESILPLCLAMEAEGISFVEDYDTAINYVKADRNRLTQILINLLTNAMKHAGLMGVIKLSIILKETNVLFSIRDNGSGIRPADMEHIFERFYRSDESRTRNDGGTGLGLAIARSYVEAHGGQIWVESGADEGTTFFFTIPA